MIRPILLAGALALASSPSFGESLASAGGRYAIEPSSRIVFSVGQVGGGGIEGQFRQFSGTFIIDAARVSRSAVSFTLRPASVQAGQPRITNFLRSSAVFDVDNHPAITFRSTRVTQTGPRSATVEGVLSARGVARRESFEVVLLRQQGRGIAFHVTGNVQRSPYGMDVGTPIYSNVVKFDMTVEGRR